MDTSGNEQSDLPGATESDGAQVQEIVGTEFADLLRGTDGDDVMRGLEGSDILYGSAGADVIDGGGAPFNGDQVNYEDSPTGVLVDLQIGSGRLGHAEGDSYISIQSAVGSRFEDQFTGNDAEDNLFIGGDGNDTFISSGGANTYIGEGGTDTVSYASSSIGVTVDLAAGTGQGGDAEGDEYFEIEDIVGSRGDDTLKGDDGDNVISGEVGNDRLFGGGGDDTFIVIASIGGTDTIEDFSTTDDLIRVFGLSSGTSFADLKANNLSQVGDDALLDFGNGNSVTLLGIDVDDLAADDFAIG